MICAYCKDTIENNSQRYFHKDAYKDPEGVLKRLYGDKLMKDKNVELDICKNCHRSRLICCSFWVDEYTLKCRICKK